MACQPLCPQCTRLRAAALAAVGVGGLEAVTLRRLCSETGWSADEVVRHYVSAQMCLYDAYDEVALGIYEDFADAFAAEASWRDALTRATWTLLERLAGNPDEARLCFVEILRGDYELLRRGDVARRRILRLLVRERSRRRDTEECPRVRLELLVGACFRIVSEAVADGRGCELLDLLPELVARADVFELAAA